MTSENLSELVRIITALDTNEIGSVIQLFSDFDRLPEQHKEIVKSYSSLTHGEQNLTRELAFALNKNKQPIPRGDEPIIELPPGAYSITVRDVHRNEQVNVVALSKGIQTILCSNLTHGSYYLLWPMVGDSDKFDLNEEGEKYQSHIRREYDPRLDKFPRIFVATVYAYVYLSNNTVDFWKDMINVVLFKYWIPEKGPYRYYTLTKNQELQMLRVYEVDQDLNLKVKPNAGYRNAPLWIDGPVNCHASPILTDEQIENEFNKFNQVLQKNGSSLAIRV